jgi:hypothetical protein
MSEMTKTVEDDMYVALASRYLVGILNKLFLQEGEFGNDGETALEVQHKVSSLFGEALLGAQTTTNRQLPALTQARLILEKWDEYQTEESNRDFDGFGERELTSEKQKERIRAARQALYKAMEKGGETA